MSNFDFSQSILSSREEQIMELVSNGLTTSEIGELLFISETTVITHKQNIKDKLKAKNSCHCVSLFLRLYKRI